MCRFGNCEIVVRHPRICVHEKRSGVTFINGGRNAVRKITVDGCAITDGIRCDFLLIDHFGKEHFVELKGCDIKHALKQLAESIRKLSVNAKTQPKSSYISSTRCPLFSPEIQKHSALFKMHFNSSLLVRNGFFEIHI